MFSFYSIIWLYKTYVCFNLLAGIDFWETMYMSALQAWGKNINTRPIQKGVRKEKIGIHETNATINTMLTTELQIYSMRPLPPPLWATYF